MHDMHPNSIEAYCEELQTGHIETREEVILNVVRTSPKPLTDRDVLGLVGMSDMNCVRPRITELIKAGFIREVDSITCPVTHKQVRRVAINEVANV